MIHDRRTNWCYVSGFETFLCCKACVFQEACWPEPHNPALPCREERSVDAKAGTPDGAIGLSEHI
jgi:hypothetical protein